MKRWIPPSRRLAILVTILIGQGAGIHAAPNAEGILKSKALRRSGSTYVLPAEAEVQSRIKEASNLFKQVSLATLQQRAYAQGTQNRDAMIQDLTQRRIMLNAQLAEASTVQQNNQLVAMVNQVTDTLNLLRQDQASPEAKDKLDAEASRVRGVFIEAVLELRRLVDSAQEAYKTLADDSEVQSALKSLNQASKAPLTLGPSRAFLSNLKLLEKVEASVLSETVTLQKKGGIFWLDVTFNGKVTRSMAFDTGASDVVLPPDYAAAIGLVPRSTDPTVRTQVADGSIVEAKQMTIPSMRVGKFTIKDVSCIVMPAEKSEAPPLLGGTFHKYFTYKFSPESGTLVLSKIDTPEPAKAPPARTKPGRPARSRR